MKTEKPPMRIGAMELKFYTKDEDVGWHYFEASAMHECVNCDHTIRVEYHFKTKSKRSGIATCMKMMHCECCIIPAPEESQMGYMQIDFPLTPSSQEYSEPLPEPEEVNTGKKKWTPPEDNRPLPPEPTSKPKEIGGICTYRVGHNPYHEFCKAAATDEIDGMKYCRKHYLATLDEPYGD